MLLGERWCWERDGVGRDSVGREREMLLVERWCWERDGVGREMLLGER